MFFLYRDSTAFQKLPRYGDLYCTESEVIIWEVSMQRRKTSLRLLVQASMTVLTDHRNRCNARNQTKIRKITSAWTSLLSPGRTWALNADAHWNPQVSSVHVRRHHRSIQRRRLGQYSCTDAQPAQRGLVSADNLCRWWGSPAWRRAQGPTATRLRGCRRAAHAGSPEEEQRPRTRCSTTSQKLHLPAALASPSLDWVKPPRLASEL